MKEAIGEVLAQGFIEPHVARKLRGRLLFARSNLFCRVGAGALRQLGNVADAIDLSPTGVQSALSGLRELSALLGHIRPRLVRSTRPLFSLLFTDGAYENGAGSIGGIIFDDKKGIAAFGFSIDEHLLEFWKRKGKTQFIGLLEILPVLVAKMVFADFLTDASPCGFIDNEGARANLINGYSPDIDTGNMLSINAQFDVELGCLPWWARVPSAGNPADAPSRLDFSALSKYGNVQLRNEAHVAQYWPGLRDSFTWGGFVAGHLIRMRFVLNKEYNMDTVVTYTHAPTPTP